MEDTSRSRSPSPEDDSLFPEYNRLATRPSVEDPTHPGYDGETDKDEDDVPASPIEPSPKKVASSSQSRPDTDVQSTWRKVNPPLAEESPILREEKQGEEENEDEEDDFDENFETTDRYRGNRDMSAVQANAEAFKNLHVPGKPIFVANVHDLLTASIAANQPECQALCVDLHTLAHLVGWRYARTVEFLAKDCNDLINQVSEIAQRNGKLLTVDIGTLHYMLLEEYIPILMGKGVVGVDIRDAHDQDGFVGLHHVARQIAAIREAACDNLVDDFVVNVAMEWPEIVDEAILRANEYLDDGATVVTILRRMPSPDLPPTDFLRMVAGIKGRVGVVLQMPDMGLPVMTVEDMARSKVARVSYGNQWPYHILKMFQKCVSVAFSD